MEILLVTPYKGEMPFYFLQQQVEMIKSLKDEIPLRSKNVETNVLSLNQVDFNEMSLKDIKVFLDKNRALIEKADIVHSFSELPLLFRSFFPSTLLITLNFEEKGDYYRSLIPEEEEPGLEITTSVKISSHNQFQELLPGFTIEVPKEEFSYSSRNVVIFASTREFVNNAKKAVREIVPDAQFFIKLRSSGTLESDEEAFGISLLDGMSFLFGLTETDPEKEIDLLPLKIMSKGVPVFIVNSPFEKKFYPDFLHITAVAELSKRFNEMREQIKTEKEMRDDLHSFACRYFFFSKMTDDTVRLYNSIFYNKKKKERRPWGYWETLKLGDGYKIKHFYVAPKEKLSLQTHKHREEVWTIAEGDGKISVDGEVYDAVKGDMFIIKKEQKHRAEGGKKGLHIVEIQRGEYLGEDDIVRYDDDYGRR